MTRAKKSSNDTTAKYRLAQHNATPQALKRPAAQSAAPADAPYRREHQISAHAALATSIIARGQYLLALVRQHRAQSTRTPWQKQRGSG